MDVDHNGVRHRCGETKNTAEASESQTESTVQDVPITVEKDNPVGENKSSDQQPTDEAKLPENIPASNSENSKLGNTVRLTFFHLHCTLVNPVQHLNSYRCAASSRLLKTKMETGCT